MTFPPHPVGPQTDTVVPRATQIRQAWTLAIVLGTLLWLWACVEVGTPLWIWAFGRHWFWIGPAIWVLAGVSSGAVVRRQCRNWLLAALPLVLASLLALTTINPDDPAYLRHGVRDDPRGWFEAHRAEFDEAAEWAEDGCCNRLGPTELPEPLAHLTDDGMISGEPGSLFFAQWRGIIDDVGGFWHSPDRPPGNYEACTGPRDPFDLGDGWWMCRMRV